MDVKIKDGDTKLSVAGTTEYVDDFEEILQRILLSLKTHRGDFVYDKKFGLRGLTPTRDERELKNNEVLINEAVAHIDGVSIKLLSSVKGTEGIDLKLTVNYKGKSLMKEVTV